MNIKMSAKEQAIANEIMKVDTEWQTITENDMEDFSLAEDPYKLPKEAETLRREKRFAFKWILNDLARLKEVMSVAPPLKWWVCNRTNIPELEKCCSDVDGAVHCRDQILVFKPHWMLVAYQELMSGMQKAKMPNLDDRDGERGSGYVWHTGEDHGITKSDALMGVSENIEQE